MLSAGQNGVVEVGETEVKSVIARSAGEGGQDWLQGEAEEQRAKGIALLNADR